MNLGDVALAMVEVHGLRVIPLGEDREPMFSLRHATNDPAVVREWWGEVPDAPVGIVWGFQVMEAPEVRRPLARVPDHIDNGSRNSTLTRLAGVMRRAGFSEQAMEAALRVTNQERCYPALTDREVRTIARSVARYEPAEEPWQAHLRRAVS